jgi:acetolactate synthase-1/2/3 large subunit
MQTLQKTKATSKQEKVSQSALNGTEAVNISGSEAVMRALVAEKVDTIFGYPGGAIMPIYDALYDYVDELKHILVRHEQGAVHAAQGYARTSGKVGVVFATSGPGATNLVTGLADAMIDSTPVVCITVRC